MNLYANIHLQQCSFAEKQSNGRSENVRLRIIFAILGFQGESVA